MKLSIIVPCYNEVKNIPLILERFGESIHRNDVEVILVDNGSTDSTAAELKQLLPEYKFARSVTVPVNQGYGYGIMQGLKAAEGEFIGWTHADMQTDPRDVLRALAIIEKKERKKRKEKIYVKGSRKGRSISDRIFTNGMSLFEYILLKAQLYDINAQPNIFHKKFFEKWKNPPHDFSLDLYAFYMARRLGLEVIRFPVLFPERIHGVSKWNTGLRSKWKFIKRTVGYSINLKRSGIR